MKELKYYKKRGRINASASAVRLLYYVFILSPIILFFLPDEYQRAFLQFFRARSTRSEDFDLQPVLFGAIIASVAALFFQYKTYISKRRLPLLKLSEKGVYWVSSKHFPIEIPWQKIKSVNVNNAGKSIVLKMQGYKLEGRHEELSEIEINISRLSADYEDVIENINKFYNRYKAD